MFITEPPVALPAQAFATPTVVTRTAKRDAGPPALAVNAAGHALVAWRDTRGRVLVRRDRERTRTAFAGAGFDPAAALRADGSAAVAYVRYLPRGRRRLEVVTARSRRAFSRPHRLVSVVANVSAWRVLAAGDRFVAVWWQGVPGRDHAVRYAVSDAAGRFGPARTLARVDGEGAVSAAVAADGTVVAAFRTPVRDGGASTYATLAPAADRFGAPLVVADSENTVPRASGGPGGVAVGFADDGELRIAPAGAKPRTIATIPEDPEDLTEIGEPVFALRGPHATVAAWVIGRFPNGDAEFPNRTRVEAAQEQPDGTFSAPARLSARGENLQAAATPATAVLLWSERRRVRYSLNLQRPRTLTARADETALTAAADHVFVAYSSGGTIRLSRLR